MFLFIRTKSSFPGGGLCLTVNNDIGFSLITFTIETLREGLNIVGTLQIHCCRIHLPNIKTEESVMSRPSLVSPVSRDATGDRCGLCENTKPHTPGLRAHILPVLRHSPTHRDSSDLLKISIEFLSSLSHPLADTAKSIGVFYKGRKLITHTGSLGEVLG